MDATSTRSSNFWLTKTTLAISPATSLTAEIFVVVPRMFIGSIFVATVLMLSFVAILDNSSILLASSCIVVIFSLTVFISVILSLVFLTAIMSSATVFTEDILVLTIDTSGILEDTFTTSVILSATVLTLEILSDTFFT